MPSNELWAGALSLVLIHEETGCLQSALNAARLLEQLSDTDGVDDATRLLCERASERLNQPERLHACAA
jgi:hypothetical protein